MRTGLAFLAELYGMPGARHPATSRLRAQAAALHASLVRAAAASAEYRGDQAMRALLTFLDAPGSAASKCDLLDHSLLVDALHSAASRCPALRHWDEVVAPRDAEVPDDGRFAHAKLGNVALGLLLKSDPDWCGSIRLACDAFGDVRFATSPWKMSIVDRHDAVATIRDTQREATEIEVRLDRHHAQWQLVGNDGGIFLRMPRRDLVAMITAGATHVDACQWQSVHPKIVARFSLATSLGSTAVRFDPVAFQNAREHAGMTGAIVESLVLAIRQNSPNMAAELGRLVQSVWGFEIPAACTGTLESFSNPRLPGVIGFNIAYTEAHQPRFNEFCFTWLAHELGHTKQYLIEDVIFASGARCLDNPGDRTPVIPRYRRSVAVRTLFHVPYVHLYEWVVLMDFIEHAYAGLPWNIHDDAIAFGEDLSAEILEAWQGLAMWAQLTSLGGAVIARQHVLYARALARWRRIKADRAGVSA